MYAERKKAILAVSFGTSYPQTREKTIDKIEQDMRNAYPDIPVYRAWTSRMILRKLRERDNVHYDNVSEAMERMADDGIKEVIVQPTHMLDGIENEKMKTDVLKYQGCFEKILFSQPLLAKLQDIEAVMLALQEIFSDIPEKEALVFMGHGTPHCANSVYTTLEYMFRDCGQENVYVGTVEGYPKLQNVINAVGKKGYSKVHLAPLMIVAGDHAQNDMAGSDESSWKSMFEKEGYDVECHLSGMGEFSGIRNIFLQHLDKTIKNQ